MTTYYQINTMEVILLLKIHRYAAFIAMSCIAIFLTMTVISELFSSEKVISSVKSLIVWPGLLFLIPSIALTGASGFLSSKSRTEGIVSQKRKRMAYIGANGIFVLIPCAIHLDRMALSGVFDTSFYLVQGIEILAGAINLILISFNMRDGFKLRGRYKQLQTMYR